MQTDGVLGALASAVTELRDLGVGHALVGGLAVSARAEVRFTRDVDLAIAVASDAETEGLAWSLGSRGYRVFALAEHATRARLATVRLVSPFGVTVDLLAASSGIEAGVVSRATHVGFPEFGDIPVATVEDLVALKVLAFDDGRLQDLIDARALVACGPCDLDVVRARLREITDAGYHRGQDLQAKLDAVLAHA